MRSTSTGAGRSAHCLPPARPRARVPADAHRHLHRRRRRAGAQCGHPGGGPVGSLPRLAVLRHPAGLRGTALVQRRRPPRPRRGPRHHPSRRHDPRHHQPRQPVPLRHAGRARQRVGDRPLRRPGGRLPGQRLRRPGLDRWRRQPPDLAPALVQGASGRLRAQDDRQRRERHPAHLRLRHRREHRDRGARQAPLHRREPRPGDGGRADGPIRGLDRALQRPVGQRRRDPHPRDPVRHREGVRQDPGPRGRRTPVQHRRRRRGRAPQRRRDRAGRAAGRRHRWTGSAGSRARWPGPSS